MKAILNASAALVLGATLFASGGASAQQMLASKNCANGDTIRMMIARDAVVVERRSSGWGAPTAVQAFDMWNFRAAQSAFNSICY
ncbi:hypothetical protein [Neomegalonema perideroedes]|uniref:hypothetical protein n=1 Tax=Neomegalonema perideroedes TaxID=217219 RepID=UPI0003680140|nr:hypothetical protein [Neomegalonema perideroedes]